jgi:rSAM/selenodomain-associated transferase 2
MGMTSSSMRISVIIPALNEAENVGGAIASARSPSTTEIIVVDGSSFDDTAEVAASYGARCLVASRGRAEQMNAGAAVAVGDVLLFLHADTILPVNFDHHVRDVLSDYDTVGGAFKLSLDGPERGLRFIERMVNWRSTALRMPYGDQAIFLRAQLFRDIGGFPVQPIMEDFELMLRLRKKGSIGICSAPVVASARRWRTLGIAKTTFLNQAVILAYNLGINPSRIARWYYQRLL